MKSTQRSQSVGRDAVVGSPGMSKTAMALALGTMIAGVCGEAQAGSADFGNNTSLEYTVTLNYALAMRLNNPADSLVNGPVSTSTGLSSTVNQDDGDRNFKSGSLINNRISTLIEANLHHDNYGAFVRGDGFYDQAYHHPTDNDSPDTVNRTGANNEFTPDAKYFQGNRVRLLDAYVYGDWNLGGTDLNVRLGRQVVAWGEGLFFPNISGAQGPADATKANVPGIEVKDILLPVSQASVQYSLTRHLSLMGYYQFQYKANELDPVGDYMSYTDVVGPGAQFINAFALAPGVNYKIQYAGDNKPSAFGQWGLGLHYGLGSTTELGLYQLRYDDKNPIVTTNYGMVSLAPGVPAQVLPTTYNIGYQSGIDLTGVSLSSSIGPVNVAGEVSYKNGVPVLVNTAAGPTATPAKATQAQASAIYIVGPSFLAREIDLVGEAAYLHVNGVESVAGGDSGLTNTRNAWAYEGTATLNYPNVFNGWDLAVPFSWAHAVTGTAAVAGAFGSLVGHGDQRASAGLTFTYLSKLEVAASYNAFLGSANPTTHPLADRDYVALNVKYRF